MFWSQNTWPLSPSSGTPWVSLLWTKLCALCSCPAKQQQIEGFGKLRAQVRDGSYTNLHAKSALHVPKRLDKSCHNCRLGRFQRSSFFNISKRIPCCFNFKQLCHDPVFGHLFPLSHIQSYLISGLFLRGPACWGKAGWTIMREQNEIIYLGTGDNLISLRKLYFNLFADIMKAKKQKTQY